MTTAARSDLYAPATDQGPLTWSQRMILRRLHPVAIIFDMIGVMWAVYFLWIHNWMAAIGAIGVFRAIGLSIAWRARLDLLSQTAMGRVALLHLHPVNVAVQVIGIALAVWGLWIHAGVPILGGLSLILAGHAVGWGRVHKALAL